MKNIIAIIAGSLLLLGCGTQQSQQHMSDLVFPGGSTHDAIVKHLKQVHAKILKDSPELVSAEFNIPEWKRPMRIELGFTNDSLNSIDYITK